MTDVDGIRNPVVRNFALPNVDRPYVFFYDETNNVRKLGIEDGRLNIARPECFVLAGVAQRQPSSAIDLAPLRERLRLQPTVGEIKLRHIGKGGFLDILSSPKLRTFLRWLTDEGLFVHYHVTDVLYWSIVDIVDSIIAGGDEAMGLAPFGAMLKDGLYAILRDDVEGTAEMLSRYRYPDVGPERRQAFMRELLDVLEAREGTLEHFEHYMLKGLLQMGGKAKSLPFIENETPDVLIETFGHFFLHRIALFKNSEHILDEEPVIDEFLEKARLTSDGMPFRNHRFADSRSEAGIQLSDVVAGLLGKAFSYVNQTPHEALSSDLEALSDQQRASLLLLSRLLDRSTDESPAFAHRVLSAEDQSRAALLLEP